jgi:hypothetical protein
MPATTYTGTTFDAAVRAALVALYAAGRRTVYVQMGKASGDVPHVASALALNSTFAVLVTDGTDSGTKGKAQVADIYVDSLLLPDSQVAHVSSAALASGKAAAHAMNTYRTILAGSTVPTTGVGKLLCTKLTQSTKDFTDLLTTGTPEEKAARKATLAEMMRGALNGATTAGAQDGALRKFLADKGVKTDKFTIVLWGRQSPTEAEGGIHYESNSSATGMNQLAKACLDKGYQVLTAGDWVKAMEGEARDARVAREAEKLDKHADLKKTIFLGQFWKDSGFPTGTTRAAQIRLFYTLQSDLEKQAKGMLHVGMRSGGLDMFGFGDQPVLYIIGAESDDARMAKCTSKLQEADFNYERAVVSHNPKRYGRSPKTKLSRGSGFEAVDVTLIMNKITAMLPIK